MSSPAVVESVPLPSESPMPWLLVTHDIDDAQVFSTAPFHNESESYVTNIPALRGKTICASQGWLVLLDANPGSPDCYCITLWNPVTSKSINLPPLEYHYTGDMHWPNWPIKFLLTSPPSDDNDNGDSNCFLFFCLGHQAFACRCQPRRESDSSCRWYSQRLEINGQGVRVYGCVALKGVIYGYVGYPGAEDHLICIDIVDDDASNPFTLTPLQIYQWETYFSYLLSGWDVYVVESCGSIYIVTVGTQNNDSAHAAKVWELDLEQGICVEVKSLGDRAFFLCSNGCTWCWASTTNDCSERGRQSVEGNCLYFYNCVVTHGVGMYSLEDCSSTLLPCLPCGISLDDTWSDSVNWVMPQHRLFEAGREGRKSIDKEDDVSKSCLTVSTTECKQALQQNEPQEEGRLSELPGDLIELLSRYLHLFDYWNFRCTSKIIHSATPLPLWRTNNAFPLFLVFENDGGLCRLMDPCRDDSRSCIFQFYEEGHFDILFSKDGWLLVSDCETFEFVNPFTGERGEMGFLPPRGGFTSSIGFSNDPTCSQCLSVLKSDSSPIDEIVIEYFKYGDGEWSSRFFESSQYPRFLVASGRPVYHAGAFYWLDTFGILGVFKLVDEDTSWRVYDTPLAETPYPHSCYLLECGQELISVFIMDNGNDVLVFRFKQSDKKWVNVESLGDYTLFLRPNSSTSVATKDTKMKNRIYLPFIQGNHIVYYSLETKKYYVNNTETHCNNFFYKKIPSRCCWI